MDFGRVLEDYLKALGCIALVAVVVLGGLFFGFGFLLGGGAK